jgi:hypothetical protein
MTECCCVSIDYEDGPAVCTTVDRVARKVHVCSECGDDIQPGEKYEYVAGLWDGSWSVYKTCWTCCMIRDDLLPCGYFHGNMREDIWECYGVDLITGETSD